MRNIVLPAILPFVVFASAQSDSCPVEGQIDFDSFQWCHNEGGSCTAAPGGDMMLRKASAAVLYREASYEVKWKCANETLPVRIEWYFVPWGRRGGEGEMKAMWSTNVTGKSSFTFKPSETLDEFPTGEAPDVEPPEASAASDGWGNFLKISQGNGDELNHDWSDGFALVGDWAENWVQDVREGEREEWQRRERQWQLGVGISVGLGVPLLIGGTWMLARRSSSSSNGVKDQSLHK